MATVIEIKIVFAVSEFIFKEQTQSHPSIPLSIHLFINELPNNVKLHTGSNEHILHLED